MADLTKIVVDVRELEAPQPLVEIVQALKALDTNSYLKILHRMKPCRVYDIVKQKQLCQDTIETKEGVVMYIYHCQNKEIVWSLQD